MWLKTTSIFNSSKFVYVKKLQLVKNNYSHTKKTVDLLLYGGKSKKLLTLNSNQSLPLHTSVGLQFQPQYGIVIS